MLRPGDNIRYLKGVGEKRARLYQKLGIMTVEDLLCHLPRNYLDLTSPVSLKTAPVGEHVVIRATVLRKERERRIRKGLSLFKVMASGQDKLLEINFFNGKYTVTSLREGEDYFFYGTLEHGLYRLTMNSPQVYPIGEGTGLLPIYPLTAGISNRAIRKQVAVCLSMIQDWRDPLAGTGLLEKQHLPGYHEALRMVHAPQSWDEVRRGRNRLVFDELLVLCLSFARLKKARKKEAGQGMHPVPMAPFYESLPFRLTGAQQRAVRDVLEDLQSPVRMNRLIEGDVGSGKTVVAAAGVYFTACNGLQSALMAPTELLAGQHYNTLRPLLEKLGLRVALLTGSQTAKEKRNVKEALADGQIDFIIGTHALLTEDTVFSDLGLVITDEQHRFGVEQRSGLEKKGRWANVLVMSATPIPRTLALIIYGDLELSVIDELPKGRKQVRTYLIDGSIRERAFNYVKKHLDAGYQAYLVCPAVQNEDSSESLRLKAAVQYRQELADGPFHGYRVGLLHGQMKAAEKDATMLAFANGETDLLVATTVIEVGIDVPNAVLMVVENAERFGLSQLHQLRGRVGRGTVQSHCILISDHENEDTKQRLKTLTRMSDGFKIAEEDLRLRGPGDFFGNRQHGLPELRVADFLTDASLLKEAETAAGSLFAHDPKLDSAPGLRWRVEAMEVRLSL